MIRTLIALFILIGIGANAQNHSAVDYKSIEKKIKKKKSEMYYPDLMERFLAGDTSLNLEEKRHVYYGYAFQKEYSPYGSAEYSDSLLVYLKLEEHDSLSFEKIIHYADLVLEETPFDIKTMRYQMYAMDQLVKMEHYGKRYEQYNIVVDALMSSGDGRSDKNAFLLLLSKRKALFTWSIDKSILLQGGN